MGKACRAKLGQRLIAIIENSLQGGRRRPACRYVVTFPLTGYVFGWSAQSISGIDTREWIVPGAWTALEKDFAKHPPTYVVDVQVPAKITVVPTDQLDQLVPKISRYANSQNAIAEADFESNNPFHIELERLSRTICAPAPAGGTMERNCLANRDRQGADLLGMTA